MDELARPLLEDYQQMDKIPLVILLDNVRSMLNVGAVFRSADAFMIEKIFLCGITAKPPHREIQKSALGATETVSWEYYEDILKVLHDLKALDYTIIGLEQTNHSIKIQQFEITSQKKYALILGNEVEGIQDKVLPMLDAALEIPQSGTKHSLNVSVAAGIAMYKFYEKLML